MWGALALGAMVLGAAIVAALVLGPSWLDTRRVEEAARSQLSDIGAGDLAAAYGRTSASYRAAHDAEEFIAFVERHPGLRDNTGATFAERAVTGDRARLSGTLSHAGGSESVVYELQREDDRWKVAGLAVNGDTGAGAGPTGRLAIELVGVDKSVEGQTTRVRIDVRVAGFDARPSGRGSVVHLQEDLETIGPDGRRMDDLSRVGLQEFNKTIPAGQEIAATFNNTLTFTRPAPGRYRVVITIRDLVGNHTRKRDVTFELP